MVHHEYRCIVCAQAREEELGATLKELQAAPAQDDALRAELEQVRAGHHTTTPRLLSGLRDVQNV